MAENEDKCGEKEADTIAKAAYKSGLATERNLTTWAKVSRDNSFHADKGQSRHDLDASTAGRDREDDYVPNDERWQEKQRQEEGRGYTFSNDLARKNSFTGDK